MNDFPSPIPTWYQVTPEQERVEVLAAVGEDLCSALAAIELVVLDADGIFTNGGLIYGPEGEALKEFNAQDGLGLVLGGAGGIKRAVLTGRNSPIVARRCRELHFEAIKMGRFDKAAALAEILAETKCSGARTMYMGDDVIDMAAMAEVLVPVTVPEASAVVKSACRHVTTAPGGHGAIREVMDLILKSKGEFGSALGRMIERHGVGPARGHLHGEKG